MSKTRDITNMIAALARDQAKGAGDLEAHQDVCTERYGNIDSKLEDIKTRMSTHETTFHSRLDAMSNRMWGVMIGVCVGSCSAVGMLIMYLINNLSKK